MTFLCCGKVFCTSHLDKKVPYEYAQTREWMIALVLGQAIRFDKAYRSIYNSSIALGTFF